jgi:hypothetical protein
VHANTIPFQLVRAADEVNVKADIMNRRKQELVAAEKELGNATHYAYQAQRRAGEATQNYNKDRAALSNMKEIDCEID